MVDDGRKVYTSRNAMDAHTGRTISTPDHLPGSDGMSGGGGGVVAKVLLYGGLAAVIAAGGIAVARVWFS